MQTVSIYKYEYLGLTTTVHMYAKRNLLKCLVNNIYVVYDALSRQIVTVEWMISYFLKECTSMKCALLI